MSTVLPIVSATQDNRALPVTLDDAKEHLRIEHNDEDRYILLALQRAVSYCEQVLGTSIIRQTYTLVLEEFPVSDYDGIPLPNPPVGAVSSITYYDSSNTQQTLSSALYNLHKQTPFPTIYLAVDQTWPAFYERPDAVTVTYTAGYAETASTVPAAIHQAILLYTGDFYAFRENVVAGQAIRELPGFLTANTLLAPFRTYRL